MHVRIRRGKQLCRSSFATELDTLEPVTSQQLKCQPSAIKLQDSQSRPGGHPPIGWPGPSVFSDCLRQPEGIYHYRLSACKHTPTLTHWRVLPRPVVSSGSLELHVLTMDATRLGRLSIHPLGPVCTHACSGSRHRNGAAPTRASMRPCKSDIPCKGQYRDNPQPTVQRKVIYSKR